MLTHRQCRFHRRSDQSCELVLTLVSSGNFFGMNIPPGLCVGSVPPSAPADSVLRRPSHGAYDVHDKRIAGLTTRRVWAIGHFRHRESIRIRGEDA